MWKIVQNNLVARLFMTNVYTNDAVCIEKGFTGKLKYFLRILCSDLKITSQSIDGNATKKNGTKDVYYYY